MFELWATGLGIETGVDLDKTVDAGNYISSQLGRPPASRASAAIMGKRARELAAAEKAAKDSAV